MNSSNGASGTGIHGNARRLNECLNRINEFTVYKKIAATNLTAVFTKFCFPGCLNLHRGSLTRFNHDHKRNKLSTLLFYVINYIQSDGTKLRGSHFITCLANESSIIEHSTALLSLEK